MAERRHLTESAARVTGRCSDLWTAVYVFRADAAMDAHAGELIHPWALAISSRLKIKSMTGYIAPYPTLGEVNKRAAYGYYTSSLGNPWLRRTVRFLARLG